MIDYEAFVGLKGATTKEIREKVRGLNGICLTEGLFAETISENTRANRDPVYSLREDDIKGYPSAYQIYMNSIDEVEAAYKLVGSLYHWNKLLELDWFLEGIPQLSFTGVKQWREDLRQRDQMIAKAVIFTAAKAGDVSAARALERMSSDTLGEQEKASGGKRVKEKKSNTRDNVADFLSSYKNKKESQR
jgi:hypothetical protein